MHKRSTMKAKIGGILDVSTIDFPRRVCSVIFFCGCPFKCPFCQNWKLFLNKNCKYVDVEKIILNLKSNFLIDSVTITGGEPLLQIDALIELLRGIKSFGFATKIDTNGYFPDNIKKLLDEKLLDYVAIDVKTAFKPEAYGLIVGLPNAGNEVIQRIKESLKLLIDSRIILEARTTIVPGLIEKEKEIEWLAKDIQGVSLYVLQQFRPSEGTLDPKFENLPFPSRKRILELAKVAKKYLSDVRIRTIEKGEERILG